MKRYFLFLVPFGVAAALLLTTGLAPALGDTPATTAVIDANRFVTIEKGEDGNVLSLYRVTGDRIVLVDVVINSTKHSIMSIRPSKRYLYRVELENK